MEKIETATISASEKVSLLKRELEEQQRFSQVQMETAEKEISRLLTELESASSYREKSETLSEEVNRLNLRLRENSLYLFLLICEEKKRSSFISASVLFCW